MTPADLVFHDVSGARVCMLMVADQLSRLAYSDGEGFGPAEFGGLKELLMLAFDELGHPSDTEEGLDYFIAMVWEANEPQEGLRSLAQSLEGLGRAFRRMSEMSYEAKRARVVRMRAKWQEGKG